MSDRRLSGMDSQKGANWANIGSFFINIFIGIIAVVTLGYLAWGRVYPDPNKAPNVFGGALVNNWTPVIVLGSCLLLATAIQIIVFRASRRSQRITDRANAPLEILSPFDNEEVGFYEIVRGRVFPPDSNLQVLVFAGDRKWYPQPHVDVKESTWSVKCQFGNLESPSGGAYKIIAVLGNELREGMWYADLPRAAIKSNIITVYRPEITTEQKLSRALKDAEEATGTIEALRVDLDKARGDSRAWERKYHEVNNKLTPVVTERDNYAEQLSKLNRDIALAEKGHELELTGERIEKNGLKDDLARAQHEASEAHKRANEQENSKEGLLSLYREAEAKIAEWKPLHDLAKKQAEAISDYVVITNITPTRLSLDSSADRVVGVTLQILNNSVFDITISPAKVKGCFRFENKPRKEPVHVPIDADHLPIEKLRPQQPATLYIEQPLLTHEAERISEVADEKSFWLGGLSIPITIENVPLEVKFTQDVDMRIPPHLADIPVLHFVL